MPSFQPPVIAGVKRKADVSDGGYGIKVGQNQRDVIQVGLSNVPLTDQHWLVQW